MPRNRENEPSVTMSGGMFSRVTSSAFSVPPAHPTSRATSTAAGMERCQSRQALPKTMAARPIMEPTERSMPPATMMGVSARASRPNSTLRRITSKKLPSVKKFSPIRANTAISIASPRRSTHSPLGNQRSRHGLRSDSGKVGDMFPRTGARRIDGDGGQDDSTLDGFFPVSAHPQKDQRRADGAEQKDAQHCSDDSASSTGNRSS